MLGANGLGECRSSHCIGGPLHISPVTLPAAAQGFNAFGQVGDGTRTDRLTPTLLYFDGWWRAVATGDHHSCGVRSDGSLWCWVSAWKWRWWWTCGLQP